jgi:AraC family transcriptional activator FtrA
VPPRLLRALTAAHERGARLASICSGAFVLAEAGLLDGNTATTHSRYAEALSTRFTHIDVNAGVLYVDDGRVLTSAGRAGKRKA